MQLHNLFITTSTRVVGCLFIKEKDIFFLKNCCHVSIVQCILVLSILFPNNLDLALDHLYCELLPNNWYVTHALCLAQLYFYIVALQPCPYLFYKTLRHTLNFRVPSPPSPLNLCGILPMSSVDTIIKSLLSLIAYIFYCQEG